MIKDFDPNKLMDVYISDIDTNDYPDFCDAFLDSAEYEGRELTEKECEWITDTYPGLINELVFQQLL